MHIFKCNIGSDIKSSINNLVKVLTADQPILIDTPLVKLLLIKQDSTSTSNSVLNIGQNSFSLPSFCQMLNKINCDDTKIIIQVIFILYLIFN